MGPVRVKVYGLFARTRRRYLTGAAGGVLLLLAALVTWWLGWAELQARLKRLPQVRGVRMTEAVLANAPWVIFAAAVLKSIELVVVLRRRPEPAAEVHDRSRFEQVVRAAFAYRRKTLANSLSLALGLPRAL